MKIQDRPIGVFDSGVGGISVLREAIKLLPVENFIYYGDSKNAPYGTKSKEEVKKLTLDVAKYLVSRGIKALVVACNTATSAAIEDLRREYINIPIIGIEPALKPAVEFDRDGKVIIMATQRTLADEKFNEHMKMYKDEADIVKMPCPKLVEFVESGTFGGGEVNEYLRDKLNPYLNSKIAAVVLGCTHFPFVKDEIKKIIKDVPIIDGGHGTASQLKNKLVEDNILRSCKKQGDVEILNSLKGNNMIEISKKLLYK
ncbi:MAG: glutamate racemase [Clostridium sp.]|nr:glutamate racemase [Clostridium sp.]